MKPGRLNLPDIWRGSSYPDITFTWLDANGDPVDLTGWTPVAKSLNIDFHPQITDPSNGVTTVSFSKDETARFVLGVELWDWRWIKDNTPLVNTITTPVLRGFVQIKEPQSIITPAIT